MNSRVVGMLIVAAFIILPVAARAADKDQEAIQGTWKIDSAQKGGQELPADKKDSMTVEFKGNMAIVHRQDEDRPAEFTLDSSKSPKEISIKPKKEGEKEVHGIYELKGDTLTICVVEEGDRPTKLESPADSKVMLMVLKRDKK